MQCKKCNNYNKYAVFRFSDRTSATDWKIDLIKKKWRKRKNRNYQRKNGEDIKAGDGSYKIYKKYHRFFK
jgi:hypothetical protein